MNLFERLFPTAHASRLAILYEDREISYAELRAEVLRVTLSLHEMGISTGDRVAILLADSPEFITSFVAIISLGAIAVPINLALRREDQLFILKDCGARAAIMESSHIQSLFNEDAPPELKDILVVHREGDPHIDTLAGIAAKDFRSSESPVLEDDHNGALADGRATAPSATGDADRDSKTANDADAFILYTSGSTGEPKGAVHSQSDIFYTNETYSREVLNLREDDRLFSSSRLPFAYGLGNAFTFPLLNGFTTILCREKPAPAVIARVFAEYQPTIFFGVPVVYRMLLEYHRQAFTVPSSVGSLAEQSPAKAGALNTASLRLCISAGEALPSQLGEEWQKTFGVQVLDGIGSTEMLHMFMSNHVGELRYGSSGKLLQGYQARLIDHEGVATNLGEVGNLWIRGDSAAARYWQRPETTSQTFVDGWVRTGDLYRCDEDGFWWHMGRSDDCFKPTGQWVSPIEVENVLIRSESVRAAAVVEGQDPDGLACVCAFLVLSELYDSQAVEAQVRALCEQALPRFKQPRRYYFVSDLPYTATGKVQRFKLREQLRAEKRETP